MRILHIVSNVSLRSGIMSSIMNYYRHIDKDNYQFDFLYYEDRDNDYKTEISKLGGECYKSPNPLKFKEFNKFLKLFQIEHYSKYEIIQLHDHFLCVFYSRLKKGINAKSFVSYAHNTRFGESNVSTLRNRITSWFNRYIADYYFACSEEAGNAIFGSKFKKNGFLINNAIEVPRFVNSDYKREKVRIELGLEKSFVVGHVGNFVEQKNHDFIVSVFYEISKVQDNAVLVLVGEGPLKRKIENKCEQLGIKEKVLFLGIRNDVNKIVCGFDRMLFPSLFEGLGIVLIEAQCAGIPCVFSSNVPKVANICKRNNRVLCLSDPISIWVYNVLDPTLIIDFDSNKDIIENGYAIDIEARRLQNIYMKIMGEKYI